MDPVADPELFESVLNIAACKEMLEDSLDRLSLTGSRSNSRESLQSSSKFDSAFDSHYSEDTLSMGSSVVTGMCAVEAETSMLPTILTPPLAYRVTTPTTAEGEGSGSSPHHHPQARVHTRKRSKDRSLRDHVLKKRHSTPTGTPGWSPAQSPTTPTSTPTTTQSPPKYILPTVTSTHSPSRSPRHATPTSSPARSPAQSPVGVSDLVASSIQKSGHTHNISEPVFDKGVLPSPHKPELVYLQPSPQTPHRTTPTNTKNGRADNITKPQDTPRPTGVEIRTPSPLLLRCASDSSSSEDLISNASTPRNNRHLPQMTSTPSQEPLNPRVTIIYPQDNPDSDSDDDYPRQYGPRYVMRQSPQFPKRGTGTVFYQESLTPQPSPLRKTHTVTHRHSPSPRRHGQKFPSSPKKKYPSSPGHKRGDLSSLSPRHSSSPRHSGSPSHLLPSRYLDSSHTSADARKMPKRTASILQRLKRRRGSFKEENRLKKRLPVKRSLSDRMAYNIQKGWVDYQEDLNFISQPSYPRAVGRMIDKKAGRYHVVQLYKPPNGRYGIYISQLGNRSGIFISRFADATAAKFYAGLISPGDQIIRVNGKNIVDQSVDTVYDLMTASDSVIFTVIPVSPHSNWW